MIKILNVLTLEVVKAAIEELQSLRIHEQFLAYLQVRAMGIEQKRQRDIEPNLAKLAALIEVPGGPEGKPFYRPFSSRQKLDATGYWLNKNIAGSYAPSSLRNASSFMLDKSRKAFKMPNDHARQASDLLLKGTPVPAWAFAAYLMRDLEFPSHAKSSADLVSEFRKLFHFESPEFDSDFEILFTSADAPVSEVFSWEEYSEESRDAEARALGLDKIRSLTASDLGITAPAVRVLHTPLRPNDAQTNTANYSGDPEIRKVMGLTKAYGGVILSGPPGTGKSWLAARSARALVDGQTDRLEFVQFHPSYQFDDFMEGFRPKDDGTGFEKRDGVFLRLARKAAKDLERNYVIVIDELSRTDVGRVFGEALTYVETSKRDLPFTLPSGEQATVPRNLRIIATMNPLDKGVDDVDAAFERRFAKIEMPPDPEALAKMLKANGMKEDLANKVIVWFRSINGFAKRNASAAIGQAYFSNAADEDSLREIWEYQLQYVVDRAFRYDQENGERIRNQWINMLPEEPSGESELATLQLDSTEEQR